jgi:hypothetical protein
METRRTIVYQLDFEMKVNFHGPITEGSIIREAINNLFDMENGLNDSDGYLETVTVTPDPLTTYWDCRF